MHGNCGACRAHPWTIFQVRMCVLKVSGRRRVRAGPRQWARKDRDWFMSLTPHMQHRVCRGMWRAKNASLPWRRGGEMVSFWESVVQLLTPDIRGDEGEEELRDMRRGYKALGRVVWDLRSDREHPLARAAVGRIGVRCGGVKTIPDVWLSRGDEWLVGVVDEIRKEEGMAREEADLAWRMEAVRRVVRKRKRGESATYGSVADEMNSDPGRGRRPWLTVGGLRRAYKKYASDILDESKFDSDSDGGDMSF